VVLGRLTVVLRRLTRREEPPASSVASACLRANMCVRRKEEEEEECVCVCADNPLSLSIAIPESTRVGEEAGARAGV
jgi:hypothetical protein